jgi:CheY-like chemotaxis protein
MERPLRVLVADDCADFRASLRILLGLWGYEMREAGDGPAALRSAAAFPPDVVLLDILLPGLDGYEVARQLRQVPGLEGVRLVAVTGYGRAQEEAGLRGVAFDHYLLKPFDPVDLERLLASRPA